MVAHLTVGKKKYAEVEGQMKTIATEAAMIRERLTDYLCEPHRLSSPLRNRSPPLCLDPDDDSLGLYLYEDDP